MARKGNHQKNGLDRHGLNHKKGVSGGVLPVMKGHAIGDQVKVFPGEELPNCSQPNGLSQNANESISLGNKNNNEQKSEKLSRKEKQGMVAKHDLEEPLSFGSNVGYGSQNTEVPRREENGTSPRSNEGQQCRSRLSCLLNGLHIKSVVEKVELADNTVVRRLSLSVSSIFAAVTEWLVRQKPLFVSLTTSAVGSQVRIAMRDSNGEGRDAEGCDGGGRG